MFTTDTKARIIEFIKQNGKAANKQLQAVTGISSRGVSKHLTELVSSGQLTTQGKPPLQTYYIGPQQLKNSVLQQFTAALAQDNTLPQAAKTAIMGKVASKIKILPKATAKTSQRRIKSTAPTLSSPNISVGDLEVANPGPPINTFGGDKHDLGSKSTALSIDTEVPVPKTSQRRIKSTAFQGNGANAIARAAKPLISAAEIRSLKTIVQDTNTELKGLKIIVAHMNAELGGLKDTMATFKATVEPPKPPVVPLPAPLQPVQPTPIQVTSVQQAPYRPTGSSMGQAAPKQTISQLKRPPQSPVVTFWDILAGLTILGFIMYWLFRGLGAVMVFVFQIIDWLFAHVRGI